MFVVTVPKKRRATRERTARALRSARAAKQLSQAQIAELLDVSQPTVNAWETGKAAPSIERWPDVARVYGVQLTELLAA